MMYDPVTTIRTYEYDPKYDVRTNYKYKTSWVARYVWPLLFFIGIMQIMFTLIDMDWGVYNLNKRASGLDNILWTPNPFWPTYGKGLWIGLLLLALSILGFMAYRETSFTAIKIYGYGCLILALLNFYLILSCVKEIMYTELAKKTPNYNTVPNYLTYAANSGLVFFASLAFLLLILTGPYCFSFTRTYENSRFSAVKQPMY